MTISADYRRPNGKDDFCSPLENEWAQEPSAWGQDGARQGNGKDLEESIAELIVCRIWCPNLADFERPVEKKEGVWFIRQLDILHSPLAPLFVPVGAEYRAR